MSTKNNPYDERLAAEIDAAISRLEAGKPINAELKKQQRAGKLKINISTVARETGVSRTLIGYDQCNYPKQRKRVLGLRGGNPAQGTLLATVQKLRAELVAAKQREHRDVSLRAALLRRVYHADKAVSRAERKVGRTLSRTTTGHIGRAITEGQVVSLRDCSPDNS